MRRVVAILVVLGTGAIAKLPETLLPIGSDTGIYATYARMILHGGRPYLDFYDVHPPLVYAYWAAIEAVAGSDWSRMCLGNWGSLAPQPCVGLLAHALDFGLTCATALVTYAIARRMHQPAFVGWLASLLVIWFANASMISNEGSTPGKLTLLPSVLAVYALSRAMTCRGNWRWAVAAGGAGALSGFAKQPGLLTLIALFVYLLPGLTRGRLRAARARRIALGLLGGTLLVTAVAFIALVRFGALGAFFDQTLIYNGERFLIGYWQTPGGITGPSTRIDRVVEQAAGLLFLGGLIGGLAVGCAPNRRRERLLLVWAVLSLVAIAGFREFAQVVPGLALLAAIGMGRLWTAASRTGLGLGRPLAGHVALVAILGSVFMLTSSFQLIEWRRAMFERGPRGTPADPEVLSTYLRQQVPDGPLFVWGNAGHVYALSNRPNASRFLISEFTDETSPRPRVSRAQLMADLESRPPEAVVLAPHIDEPGLVLDGFPEFEHLLDTCYRRVEPGVPMPSWGLYLRIDPARHC